MMPSRIDWLRVAVWTALLTLACAAVSVLAWLAERLIVWAGPWIMAHSRMIFGVVVGAGIIALWGMARKDTAL